MIQDSPALLLFSKCHDYQLVHHFQIQNPKRLWSRKLLTVQRGKEGAYAKEKNDIISFQLVSNGSTNIFTNLVCKGKH